MGMFEVPSIALRISSSGVDYRVTRDVVTEAKMERGCELEQEKGTVGVTYYLPRHQHVTCSKVSPSADHILQESSMSFQQLYTKE